MASSLAALAELPPGERGRKVMEAIQTLGGPQDDTVRIELQNTIFDKLLEQGYANDIESILIDTRAACNVAIFLLTNYYKMKSLSENSSIYAFEFVSNAFEAIVGMLSGIYLYFEEEIVPTIKNNGPERATVVLKDILKFHEEVISLGSSEADFIEVNNPQNASLKVLVTAFYDLGEITLSKSKVNIIFFLIIFILCLF